MKHILYMTLALTFLVSCNEGLKVRQQYGFSLSTWHLPEYLPEGGTAEIRFTLHRDGNFHGAEYKVSWVQLSGRGAVFDTDGVLLEQQSPVPLAQVAELSNADPLNWKFTLFYRSLSAEGSEILFTVKDNFGQIAEFTATFEATK